MSTVVLAVTALLSAPHAAAAPADCVVIDTDFDIDDMMSIPTVVGARHVAAIVATEGYTLAPVGASAISRLVAEPGQRTIPVIVGAQAGMSDAEITEKIGTYVLDYRAIMSRLNNSSPTELPPTPLPSDYVARIVAATADCARVDVLVLGTFASFQNYSPAIRSKIGRVVITGRPLEGDPELEAGESFNCVYDHQSCATVFHQQLPGLDYTFVDVPRNDNCDLTPNKAGCVGAVYAPTLAMAHALGPTGLPNTLKQIMLNDSGTWAVDTWEQSGYGGRTMLWDQSTTLALLDPSLFRPVGAHVETILNPQDFQQKWIEYTNLSAAYA